MKSNEVKKVLEKRGGGVMVGIPMFLASNGLEVEDLDYYSKGIEIINKKANEKKLPVIHNSLMSKGHYHLMMMF